MSSGRDNSPGDEPQNDSEGLASSSTGDAEALGDENEERYADLDSQSLS